MNFTSTTPSVKTFSFNTHHGKVPAPDCFITFGALGAVGSASTAHLPAPAPVTPAIHPLGIVPTGSWSKVIVSAFTGNEVIMSSETTIVIFTSASGREVEA